MTQSIKLQTVFTRENLSLATASFLVFLVFTSKNILILNEETLVALSFFCFVVFSYSTMQDSISEMFQARSDAIQTELQNYLTLKEDFLNELMLEHKKQGSQYNSIQQLSIFACENLVQIGNAREVSFDISVSNEINAKLKTLVTLKQNFQDKIQHSLSQGLRAAVLEEFQRSHKTLQPKLMKQALIHLKTR